MQPLACPCLLACWSWGPCQSPTHPLTHSSSSTCLPVPAGVLILGGVHISLLDVNLDVTAPRVGPKSEGMDGHWGVRVCECPGVGGCRPA